MIVRLNDGRHGLIAKTKGRWTWSAGERDDMLATVPDAMMESATQAVLVGSAKKSAATTRLVGSVDSTPGRLGGAIDITAPVSENLRKVAKAKKSSVSDLTVCILDRPRHAELIAQVRETGARIRMISDGGVPGAIAAARPESGTDLLVGTGGTPEGIIAAAAMRCMGGAIQARLAPTDDVERQKAIDAGHDLERILSTEDLVSGENVFSPPPASPTGICSAACASAPAAPTPSRS